MEEEEKVKERAQGTARFSVAGFPHKQWQDWNDCCKEEFGDCRWMKMWSDHCRAKDHVLFEQISSDLNELKKKIEALEARSEVKAINDKEVVKTLTGKVE